MHHLRRSTFALSVPFVLGGIAIVAACGSDATPGGFAQGDGGDDEDSNVSFDASKGHPIPDATTNTKPPPSARDAGRGMMSDARPPPPPPPPPASKGDGGGTDAGKLSDAGKLDAAVRVDAGSDAGSTTSTLTPLDPIDELLMPDDGLDVGSCSSLGITDGHGFCNSNPGTGEDFIEGCVTPETYILDCARYETAGSTRSVCEDDGVTAGCTLLDVTAVDSFEKSQTSSAYDLFHVCPSNWEGFGYCSGDFVSMCVGGEDFALDCSIYNTGTFTYTCGKNDAGNITCL